MPSSDSAGSSRLPARPRRQGWSTAPDRLIWSQVVAIAVAKSVTQCSGGACRPKYPEFMDVPFASWRTRSRCQRSKESGWTKNPFPVSRLERWSVDLAPEHRHLVAEHDHLDREVRIFATGEPDQLNDAAERPVEEREGHTTRSSSHHTVHANGAGHRHGRHFRHPQPSPVRLRH